MLELAVLGLLREGAHHGYELRRMLADFGFWSVSFGSLYPALRRLEKRGLVEAETSEDRRRRKVYSITEEGEAYFESLMQGEDADDDDRSFRLRLTFFEYLDPARRLRILERRRVQVMEERDRLQRRLRRGKERSKARTDRYRIAVLEHGVRRADADLGWIEELIAAEHTGSPDGFLPGIAPETP